MFEYKSLANATCEEWPPKVHRSGSDLGILNFGSLRSVSEKRDALGHKLFLIIIHSFIHNLRTLAL